MRALARRAVLRAAGIAAVAVLASGSLGGCADISRKFADKASELPGVGLPADAPARPSTPTAFPAVHDMPPPRNSVTLTNFEQQQMEDDLVAARDRQEAAAGVPLQPKRKKDQPAASSTAVKPSKPVSSSASIY